MVLGPRCVESGDGRDAPRCVDSGDADDHRQNRSGADGRWGLWGVDRDAWWPTAKGGRHRRDVGEQGRTTGMGGGEILPEKWPRSLKLRRSRRVAYIF